jgi:hypothetical protein
MSWKFPARAIKNPEVVSMDDVNQNFREVVEEASGALNEHNWASNSFSERNQLADDAGIVINKVAVEVNPNTDPSVTSNIQYIKYDRDWQEINGLEFTFNTTGGLVWLIASIQASSPLSANWFTSGSSSARFGLQFALEFNGAILAQSIIGGADLSNDQVTVFSPPSPPNIGFQVISSPAPSSLFFAVSTEAIIDVPPGQHTVRVVAAPPRASSESVSTASLNGTDKWLGSRELIVAQLLR